MRTTLIMPMAGKGTRMGSPSLSKPLQLVEEVPMFLRVLDCMPDVSRVVYLVKDEDEESVHKILQRDRREQSRNIVVPSKGRFTSIPADTLLGLDECKNCSVMVVHADQILCWCADHFLKYAHYLNRITVPVAMHHTSGAGFVSIDGFTGLVKDIVPKVSTDMFGLCGVYYFPSVNSCRETLSSLEERDLVGGVHYIESGIRKRLTWECPVGYYPVRNVWLMDTREDIERVERIRPWEI
jgi:GTP:adenosylcobinamide-phosphate guanylyltransferase